MAQQKGQIVIENLWNGWATDLSAGSSSSLQNNNAKAVEGFDGEYTQSKSVMFCRPGYEGHISPGFVFNPMTDTGGFVNALPLNGVVSSDGTAFVYLANSNIVNFPVSGSVIVNTAASSHTVTGTGIHLAHSTFTGTAGDIAVYSYQTSSLSPTISVDEYIFYSWEDSTDGDVGRRKKSDGSYQDNYLSSLSGSSGTALLSSAAVGYSIPHPLLIGINSKLYVGNGRFLAQHDPTLTSVNYQALDLTAGWVIVGLANYQNFVAILAYRANNPFSTAGSAKSECKMFIWDGFSPSWNNQYDVRDNYASNIFQVGADIYVISQGRNSTTKLKKFNGASFDTIYESGKIGLTPGTGTSSSSPCIGGIDLWQNHLVWSTSSGGVVNAWGSPKGLTSNYFTPTGGEMPQGFHQFALSSALNNTGNGMLKNLTGNTLFTGTQTGNSTYVIQQSDLTKFDTQSTIRSRVYPLPTNSQLDNIKFYFSQFGSGASIQAGIFKNYDTESLGGAADQLQLTINNSVSTDPTTAVGSTLYYMTSQFQGDNSNYNAFYLALKWLHNNTTDSAAIVRKVEVNYMYDDDVV